MTLTELDPAVVRASFDRAAARYDQHAVVQHEVGRRLLDRVAYFGLDPECVLDLGCGTGIASVALVGRFPAAQVVGLDWAPGMLRQLRRRMDETQGAAPVCADMRGMPFPPRCMDLVFSSLAIQWTAGQLELFHEVRRILKPGGLFLFSTFGPATLHELRTAWAQVDALSHVNRFADIQEIGDRLVAAGFKDPVMDAERIVLQYRDVLDLMRDLKAIGAHNAAVSRPAGLTGRGKLKAVLRAYEPFRVDTHYPASYEVVYGAAFAPAEGQPIRTQGGDVAEFSVEALLNRSRRP